MSTRTKEAIKDILLAALIIAEIVIGINFYLEDKAARDAAWEMSYPMANQHIEWTGAGYQGVSGR